MNDLQNKIKELKTANIFYKKTKLKIGYEISLIKDVGLMEEQWFMDMDFDTPNFFYFDHNGKKADSDFYKLLLKQYE